MVPTQPPSPTDEVWSLHIPKAETPGLPPEEKDQGRLGCPNLAAITANFLPCWRWPWRTANKYFFQKNGDFPKKTGVVQNKFFFLIPASHRNNHSRRLKPRILSPPSPGTANGGGLTPPKPPIPPPRGVPGISRKKNNANLPPLRTRNLIFGAPRSSRFRVKAAGREGRSTFSWPHPSSPPFELESRVVEIIKERKKKWEQFPPGS